jgi:hypothetical protein
MLVDLAAAKAHIRDEGAPDDQVQMYLRAAEQSAEQWLNRRIYATTDELTAALLEVPAASLSAVNAYDAALVAADALGDVRLVLDARAQAGRVYDRAADAIREIRDGIVINDLIKAGILLLFGHLYANREDVVAGVTASELPQGSKYLLQPYRVGLGA